MSAPAMSPRHILAVFLLLPRAFICFQVKPSIAQPPKPHILFLMVDQMDGRMLDKSSVQYQPPLVNLRRLAASGAHFTAAYSVSPLCTPARTSMMTGRHTSDIRVFSNGLGLAAVNGNPAKLEPGCLNSRSEEECATMAATQMHDGTFIDALNNAGYNINLYGKLHVGGGLERFAQRPDQVSDAVNFNSFNDVQKQPGVRYVQEWTRATGIVPHFNWSRQTLYTRGSLEEKHGPPVPHDVDVMERCSQLLRQGLFKLSVPQFLYCSFRSPHPPFRTNQTYLDRINLGEHANPAERSKISMHPGDEYTAKVKGSYNIDTQHSEGVQYTRRVYFAMCEMVDDYIGRILQALDEGGGKENTYIVCLSDHGEHAFENRQFGKESFLEAAARVPMMISGPGIEAQGPVRQLASLHDVYPTILHMAGVRPATAALPGESLLRVVQTGQRAKKHVVGEFHGRSTGTGVFMVREGSYKLIEYGKPQMGGVQWLPQLFNVEQDPHEVNNLADKLPSMVAHLRNILDSEIDRERADAEKKEQDRSLFRRYFYDAVGPESCAQAMGTVYYGFDQQDAEKLSEWLRRPCLFKQA